MWMDFTTACRSMDAETRVVYSISLVAMPVLHMRRIREKDHCDALIMLCDLLRMQCQHGPFDPVHDANSILYP